jgi:hypothetical protein
VVSPPDRRAALRIVLPLFVGLFCIGNGVFDWFRLAGFERTAASSTSVAIVRWVCLAAGAFVILFVASALRFMRTGTLTPIVETRGAPGAIVVYRVGDRTFEKAALPRPTWIFGERLDVVVYDPRKPERAMLVYDWMRPWARSA